MNKFLSTSVHYITVDFCTTSKERDVVLLYYYYYIHTLELC